MRRGISHTLLVRRNRMNQDHVDQLEAAIDRLTRAILIGKYPSVTAAAIQKQVDDLINALEARDRENSY
jgi:hypothetical protein